jgi:UDP-N-acetylmuramoylalanine--D-glutamate ligase
MEGADRDSVVLVTGTKGKSTTASIAGHLAGGLGRRAFTGGNLGAVPWDPVAGVQAAGADLAVIEASSYQVLDLWSAPAVIVLTSLGEDHLDWHGGSVERYRADKLTVCKLPGAGVVVANGADAVLRSSAAMLGGKVVWVDEDEAAHATWAEALRLLGAHNRVNAALAAAALAQAGVTGAGDPALLERAAAGFAGLPSRLQPAGRIGKVEFVDDSLSTNVLPTLAALDAFEDRRLALLAGGFDRGIDYSPLAERLSRRRCPTLVVTLPDNGPRIAAALEQRRLPPAVRVTPAEDLAAAVRVALGWCREEGVVLLSPAAPSFGRFADYRERAAAFRRAIESCRLHAG